MRRRASRFWLAAALAACALGAAGGASAADETVDEFVARYELALDRGDLELLRGVYEDWNPDKASRLATYFSQTVAEFNVEFSELEVLDSHDGEASVRFLRRDRFTDMETGRRFEKRIRLERTLRRHGGLWRLAASAGSRSR